MGTKKIPLPPFHPRAGMKILISAYACGPGLGSEPGVGWNWIQQAASLGEVWALTRTSNRALIEQFRKMNPEPNIHFEYFDPPSCDHLRNRRKMGIYLHYYLWQMMAVARARKLQRSIGFDLAQHVTFVNSWMPSFLWMTGIPFLWGPVGTNPYVPNQFQEHWTVSERTENKLRRAMTTVAPRIRLDLLATAVRADHIICASQYTKAHLPYRFRSKSSVIWQNGVDESEIFKNPHTPSEPGQPTRIITAGRLIAIKGMDQVLKGFAAADLGDQATLTIVGDGPWMHRLTALAQELSIANRIRFTGTLPREMVLQEFRSSDVMLFPSFEGAGMVVMEAMACGLPVICLDAGGPGEYVTNETGIKIPLINEKQVVADIGKALRSMVRDENRRQTMSEATLKRAREHFLWKHRRSELETIYRNHFKGR